MGNKVTSRWECSPKPWAVISPGPGLSPFTVGVVCGLYSIGRGWSDGRRRGEGRLGGEGRAPQWAKGVLKPHGVYGGGVSLECRNMKRP